MGLGGFDGRLRNLGPFIDFARFIGEAADEGAGVGVAREGPGASLILDGSEGKVPGGKDAPTGGPADASALVRVHRLR